jgi:ankyrin repeat protein
MQLLVATILIVEAVTALLELGAPVNAVNRLGNSTPMHMAVAGRKPETIGTVLDLLLQYEADVNITDVQGQLPFDLCPPHAEWKDKVIPAPPLWYTALRKVDLEAFRSSSEVGENQPGAPEKWQFRGRSVADCMFQVFVENEYDESSVVLPFVEFWLNQQYTHIIPNDEESFFSQYVQQRRPHHPELVKLLQPYFPSDIWQWLHRSARKNDLATVRYCIDVLHVNPNLQGRQGMTALQFAARSGQMQVLHYLLGLPDIGVNITDDRGQTPLDAARSNHRQEAVAAIEQKLGIVSSIGEK